MARLNEPVLSTAESIEILRKKMLRQNRELAKTNNIRALNIRDLENEVDRALSENLKLRARIAELEKQAQAHESRQSNSMNIRKALESQLAEWCTLLGGLGGMDPPAKKHSPAVESVTDSRRSYLNTRRSPSQRRLHNIANDVEKLGHIPEHQHSRKPLSSEEIEALICRSDDEEDYEEATEQAPPTRVVCQEPAKSDTPPREARARNFSSSLDSSPLIVPSPNFDNLRIGSVLPTSSTTPMIRESRARVDATPDTPIALPIKAGAKRKFNRDEYQPMALEKITDENMPPGAQAKGLALFEETGGKTVKELAAIRREHTRSQADVTGYTPRMPLATKSTNDDVQSPKKRRTTPTVDIAPPKPTRQPAIESFNHFAKTKAERNRAQEAERIRASTEADILAAGMETNGKETSSCSEAVVPSCSPEPGVRENAKDTPPPTDTICLEETTRPSRRSRAAISYTEPNLKDKMRRPRNETFDAVSGEGKSRRFSHSEPATIDIKRESGGSDSWRGVVPASQLRVSEVSAESAPVSPRLRHSSLPHELPSAYAGRQERMLQASGMDCEAAAPLRHSSLPEELPSVYADRQERMMQAAGMNCRATRPLRHSPVLNEPASVWADRQQRLLQAAGMESAQVSPRLRDSSLPHELPSTVQADRQLRSSHLQAAPAREESAPVSPRLRHSSLPRELPATVQADRQLRSSRLQAAPVREESDVYEFTSSSPYTDGSSGHSVTTRSGRRITATRRFSTTDDEDNSIDTRYERLMTRRRSMMV